MEKKFELLRPFDLEAAKAGEPILWGGQFLPATFVARAGNGKTNIIERPGMHGGLLSEVQYAPDEYLRMAPLAWVEGRPVYPGDVLYSRDGDQVKAVRINENGDIETTPGQVMGCTTWSDDYLTWTRPPRKVKRQGWVNIYHRGRHYRGNAIAMTGTFVFATKEIADQEAAENRIACAHVEWEEEVSE